MTLDKPVWTFSPNWDNGILERLEWMTDLLASQSGAEQRRCMRLSPRRSFEASFYLQGAERQRADIAIFMAGGIDWYIPIWHEIFVLSNALPAGSMLLPIPDTDREFRAGDYVLLRGADAFTYEVVKVDTTSDSGLQLIAATEQTWGVGTKVYPLRVGRLVEQPQPVKHTDTFFEMHVGFQLMEHNDFPATPTLDMYSGFPVITQRPDESEDLTHEYIRTLHELDGVMGLTISTDLAGRGFTTQQYRWAFAGRAANAEFRRFLYAMRGRWKNFWLPSFMADLVPTRSALSSASTIYVQNVQRAVFAPSVQQDIRIEMLDGTLHYAKIDHTAAVSDSEELVSLTAPLGFALDPTNVRAISYLNLSRFDVDQIELNHETDADGLTICAVALRQSPGLRNATQWEPPPVLAYTGTPLGCLAPCGPMYNARNDDLTYEGDYNPVSREVWAWSGNNDLLSPGVWRVGYKWDSSTLAPTGDITTQNPDIVLTSFPSGLFNFLYDAARSCYWGYGLVGTQAYVFRYDAATMACQHVYAIDPAYLRNTTTYGMAINPSNGHLWMWTPTSSGTDTSIGEFDPDLGAWLTTYTVSNFRFPYGTTHDGYFLTSNKLWMAAVGTPGGTISDPDMLKKIRTFDITTGSMSIAYTHTQEVSRIYVGPDAGKVWLQANNTLGQDIEVDCNTAAATGRVMPMLPAPYYKQRIPVYDATNDRYWSMSFPDADHSYIFGWTLAGVDLWVFDQDTNPPAFGAFPVMVESGGFPAPGKPNAVYYMTEPYDAATSTQAYFIHKVPVCHKRVVTL